MFKRTAIAKGALAWVACTYALSGLAQDKMQGVVTSTKLTMCKFEPGGCAGSLQLETRQHGRVEQLSVEVPLGTQIRKDQATTYLPALRGKMVSISYKEEKGEKIATSIDVIPLVKP